MKQFHVGVLGPGGVGGLVAAALDRAGTPVQGKGSLKRQIPAWMRSARPSSRLEVIRRS